MIYVRQKYLSIQEATRNHRLRHLDHGLVLFFGQQVSMKDALSQRKNGREIYLVNEIWTSIHKQCQSHEEISKLSVAKASMSYKELEIARGFLAHLLMTYNDLTHHLKVFI
jgi:hypothetical protein